VYIMRQLKNEIAEQYQEWKTIFWISAILNLLAYMGFIVYLTYAFDDYGYLAHKVDHIAHGRWVSGFIYNILLRESFIPTLAPVVNMAFYILSGIGLCKFWNVTKKTSLLVIAIWSLHPYLLDAYNFRMSTINSSIACLMTIATFSLVQKGKKAFVLAVILFYLVLSKNQMLLGFAVAVIMVQVLLISFRENFSAESIQKSTKLLYRYFLMITFSVIAYLLITKILFICFDVNVNPRYQAGFISNIAQLKAKICVVTTILLVRLGPVKEFILPFVGKLGIFIIYIAAMLAIIKKTSKLSQAIAVLLWIFLIPLGAISFSLPLESLALPWRTCLGLIVFFVGMLVLTQESDSLMIRRTGLLLGSFLIVFFIFNSNTVIFKQYLTNQKDIFMANRIIAKIQSLDGYQPNGTIAIIGNTEKETFSKKGKNNWQIATEYMKFNTKKRYSLTVSAFETEWSKYSFLKNYMGLELKKCSQAVLKKAADLSKDKKPWPDPSSVFIHDETVIVVLSSGS
jgi:hypothetical protein